MITLTKKISAATIVLALLLAVGSTANAQSRFGGRLSGKEKAAYIGGGHRRRARCWADCLAVRKAQSLADCSERAAARALFTTKANKTRTATADTTTGDIATIAATIRETTVATAIAERMNPETGATTTIFEWVPPLVDSKAAKNRNRASRSEIDSRFCLFLFAHRSQKKTLEPHLVVALKLKTSRINRNIAAVIQSLKPHGVFLGRYDGFGAGFACGPNDGIHISLIKRMMIREKTLAHDADSNL